MTYKQLISMSALLSLSWGFSSCDNSDEPALPPTSPTIEMSRAETDINESHNRWGLSLFNSTSRSFAEIGASDNFAISPFSIGVTLSICANTFDSDYASAVCRQFGCGDLRELNELNRKLMMYLPDKANKCEMYLSNAAWHSPVLTPTDRYRSEIGNYYFGHISAVDFTQAEPASDKINAWVSHSTRDMIKSVVRPDDVRNADVIMANALYFKSRWAEIFDANKTRRGDFRSGGNVTKADFMSDSRALRYFESDGMKAVEIPYAGSYSLIGVLPAGNEDIHDFAQRFDYDSFSETVDGLTPHMVDIKMPKFEISKSFDCSGILSDMGLDAKPNNYEGLTGSNMAKDISLKISHFVNMKTDEVGSEAGAATIIAGSVAPNFPQASISFDRPFIFFIRNGVTGSVIVAGMLVNP